MNKVIPSTLVLLFLILALPLTWAQQVDRNEPTKDLDEDTIGGIGGTGIRSMNRPDILEQIERPELLERPEQFERPELSESTDALENPSLGNEIDRPENDKN